MKDRFWERMNQHPDLTRRMLLRAGALAGDNREWALDDPDGAATTELVLEASEGDGEPTALYLPVSEMPKDPGDPELVGGQG